MRINKKPDLRLIHGSYPLRLSLGSLEVTIAPNKMQPYPVDAIAFEEDTFLVLSADKRVRDPRKHIVRIITDLIEIHPEKPGSVLVKKGPPYRFLAIIHDLDQEPTWREEWIDSALDNIFHEAEKRRFKSIAIPLLGTLHGTLDKHRFIEIMGRALNRLKVNYLDRLWIIVPNGTSSKIFERL